MHILPDSASPNHVQGRYQQEFGGLEQLKNRVWIAEGMWIQLVAVYPALRASPQGTRFNCNGMSYIDSVRHRRIGTKAAVN
jgi:hypothetical protein